MNIQIHADASMVAKEAAKIIAAEARAAVAARGRFIMAVSGGKTPSVCANKVKDVRACLIHDHFSAKQGVEHDHMNILCMGGRTVGPCVAWDLVQTFLAAEYSQAPRHLRRLGKVASIESGKPPRKRKTHVRR